LKREGPIFNTYFAIQVLLWDENIEKYCRKNCFCTKEEDKFLHEEQLEAMKRIRLSSETLKYPEDDREDPPRRGVLASSNLNIWNKGQTRPVSNGLDSGTGQQNEVKLTLSKPPNPNVFFGKNWMATVGPGGKIAPACRASKGRIPQRQTLNKGGISKVGLTAGRLGIV